MAIPVTLADARRQLRLDADDTSMDADLTDFIADAAAWVEKYTGHILAARDVVEQFGSFDRLSLSAWPIKPGAAVAVTYDVLGSPVAVTGARLSVGNRRPATALPAIGGRWPVCGPATVSVTVRAGYEADDVVPGNFRRAMLILISAYESDREGGEVFQKAETSAKALCRWFRARSL